MPQTHGETIAHLNDLIETSKDEEKGFREAAKHVGQDGESALRTFLNLYAQQRAGFAAELQNEILRLGGQPAESGHVSATFRRGWLGLKAALHSGPDYADAGDYELGVLTSCEAGERVAMENYEDVLKKNLPADLFDLVQNQYLAIRQAHEQMRLLAAEFKHAMK